MLSTKEITDDPNVQPESNDVKKQLIELDVKEDYRQQKEHQFSSTANTIKVLIVQDIERNKADKPNDTDENDFALVFDQSQTMPLDARPFRSLEKFQLDILSIDNNNPTERKKATEALLKTKHKPEDDKTPLLIKNGNKFTFYYYSKKKWHEAELYPDETQQKILNDLNYSSGVIKPEDMSNELHDILKQYHQQIEWLARHNNHDGNSAHEVLKIELKNKEGKKETYYLKKTCHDGKKEDPLTEFEAALGAVQYAISRRFVAKTIAYYDDNNRFTHIASRAIPNFTPNKSNPLTKDKLTFKDFISISYEHASEEYDKNKTGLLWSLNNLMPLLDRHQAYNSGYSITGFVSNVWAMGKQTANSYGETALTLHPKLTGFIKDPSYSNEKFQLIRGSLQFRLDHKYKQTKSWLYCLNPTDPEPVNINYPAYFYRYDKNSSQKSTLIYQSDKNAKRNLILLDESQIQSTIENIIKKPISDPSDASFTCSTELSLDNWSLLAKAAEQKDIEQVILYDSITHLDNLIIEAEKNPPKKILKREVIEKFEELDRHLKNVDIKTQDDQTSITINDDDTNITYRDYRVYRKALAAAAIRFIKCFIVENDDHNRNFGEDGMLDFDHSAGPFSYPLHEGGLGYSLRKPTKKTFKIEASQWHLFPDAAPDHLPFYHPCVQAHFTQSTFNSVNDYSNFATNITKNTYSKEDNNTFKSLPEQLFFVYYKNVFALKTMLMDILTFEHLLSFNMRKNWKLHGELYTDKLDALLDPSEDPNAKDSPDSMRQRIQKWLDQERQAELTKELTQCPEFRDFLKYHANKEKNGDLVMKTILELFEEDKNRYLLSASKDKPHYQKLADTIDKDEIMKKFNNIYDLTMVNTARYEAEQALKRSNSNSSLRMTGSHSN